MPKPSGYIPTLDGWRAIAILCVLASHSAYYLPEGWRPYFFPLGMHGVELFFGLSGLLICGRLLREEANSGEISLRAFYMRRLFRIQPAALTFLLTVCLLTLIHMLPVGWTGVLGALLMVRNLWPTASSTNLWFTSHFWSLSVEEHFYLLLPPFLLLVRKRRLPILFGTFVVQQAWVYASARFAILSRGTVLRTDMRCGTILLGCTMALLLAWPFATKVLRIGLHPGVAILYAAGTLWLASHYNIPLNGIAISLMYLLLIVSTVLHPSSILGRLLEWRPIRFVGRLSFSLYLWQQIFLVGIMKTEPGSFRCHWWLCIACAFGCALFSYYFIETPMIRYGHCLAAGIGKDTAKMPEVPSSE